MAQFWHDDQTSATFSPGKLACAFLHIKRISHISPAHKESPYCSAEYLQITVIKKKM